MKYHVICAFSILLLLFGCTFEQQPPIFSTNNGDWYTVQIGMSDDKKIVNAQLKTDQLVLEFNKGKRIEKRKIPFIFPLENLHEDIHFRVANSVNGLTYLHFTKEEPHVKAKSRITNSLKTHEMLVVFRCGNRLMVHFLAKNRPSGNLISHNLREFYFDDTDQVLDGDVQLVNSVLQFNFGKNYKGERDFPIHEFVEPHEEIKSGYGSGQYGKGDIKWTYHYEIGFKE